MQQRLRAIGGVPTPFAVPPRGGFVDYRCVFIEKLNWLIEFWNKLHNIFLVDKGLPPQPATITTQIILTVWTVLTEDLQLTIIIHPATIHDYNSP